MPRTNNPFSGKSFITREDEASKVSDSGKPIAPAGTAVELKNWVGNNPELAGIALEAELARAHPRMTLVEHLETITNDH